MFQNTPTSSHQENVPPSQPEGSGKPSLSLSLPLELLEEESMTPLPQYSHGAWGWWLRMTAPPQPQSHLDARMREQLRRSRLLSLFLLVLFSVIVVLLPKTLIPELDLGTLGALSLCSAICIGTILLNCYRFMNAAASVFVVGIWVAIAFSLLKGVEGQITKLVTLTGAPNGYEERQDQRKTIERRLYNTTEHLEQLFAHLAI